MNPSHAPIFAAAHDTFVNATVEIAIFDGETKQTATGVSASVMPGGGEPGQVGASANADSWGVSFRRDAVPSLTLHLRDWRDGTIRVTAGPSDVPVLTIQNAWEGGTGVVHCECSAKGRGRGAR